MFPLQNFAYRLFSISLGRQCLCKILANPRKNVQLANRPSENTTRGRRSSGPARAICGTCIGESSLKSTLPQKARKTLPCECNPVSSAETGSERMRHPWVLHKHQKGLLVFWKPTGKMKMVFEQHGGKDLKANETQQMINKS